MLSRGGWSEGKDIGKKLCGEEGGGEFGLDFRKWNKNYSDEERSVAFSNGVLVIASAFSGRFISSAAQKLFGIGRSGVASLLRYLGLRATTTVAAEATVMTNGIILATETAGSATASVGIWSQWFTRLMARYPKLVLSVAKIFPLTARASKLLNRISKPLNRIIYAHPPIPKSWSNIAASRGPLKWVGRTGIGIISRTSPITLLRLAGYHATYSAIQPFGNRTNKSEQFDHEFEIHLLPL